MEKLCNIANEVQYIKDFVEINIYILDNRHIKSTIMFLINDIYCFIVDYFLYFNRTENIL